MRNRAIAWIGARRAEDGQDLLEFGLLTSLIATFMIGSLTAAGRQIDTLWVLISGGF
jgi:Flp pilus assembly pilin Flp